MIKFKFKYFNIDFDSIKKIFSIIFFSNKVIYLLKNIYNTN